METKCNFSKRDSFDLSAVWTHKIVLKRSNSNANEAKVLVLN
ncbi:hypothetical protein PI23P_10685 [Polaribacter irgensii 23-P]|uniref:Uncharacterized protein n=1 Tax=Polaribacter irgensii 23-P TaxID=313594 RepID=A4C0Z6_9FLAO|nr:hypothetical protein PI23P_10685 [Polaribacter irgensii 23-P]